MPWVPWRGKGGPEPVRARFCTCHLAANPWVGHLNTGGLWTTKRLEPMTFKVLSSLGKSYLSNF